MLTNNFRELILFTVRREKCLVYKLEANTVQNIRLEKYMSQF